MSTEYAETITGLAIGHSLATGGELSIGNEQDSLNGGYGAGQAFHGTLYDVRIWNEVRSEAEISLNYQHKFSPGSLPSGLVANWQMDGINGSNQVVDVVSGNNLTVGHATGAGFIASTPVDDLHVSENATGGASVGYVVPSDPDSPRDIVSDGLFTEATDPAAFQPYYSDGSGGGNTIGDWTVTEGRIGLLNADGIYLDETPLGGNAIHIWPESTSESTLSQTLNTVAGKQYQIVFATTGNWSEDSLDRAIRVSAGGDSTDFHLGNMPANWNFANNALWQHRSMTFTADASSTTLSLHDISPGTRGVLVADVQVIEIPQAVTTILNNDPTLQYDAATGKFYRVVSGTVSWTDAQMAATAAGVNGVGGNLVSIRSQYENAIVHEFARNLGANLWIGASDAATEGDWRWASDGELFWQGNGSGSAQNGAYTNWLSSQPFDGTSTFDYARMHPTTGNWIGTDVTASLGYVIEWDASEVLSNFTFSLTDNAGGRFAIDSSTGEITVADGSLLDYETATSHNVTVEVTDAAGNSYSEAMTIAVDNVLEPMILGLPQDYVTELNQSSPLIHLRLGESSGSTAVDSAGNHDGTYLGGVVLGATGAIDGDADTAVTFANAQHIAVAHSPDLLVDEGTFQLWFKTSDITQEGTLFGKDAMTFGSLAGISRLKLPPPVAEIQVRLQSASGQYYISTNSATQPITENEWHHFAFSFGSGGMKLYIDGQLMDSDAYTGGLGTSSGGSGNAETLVIGAANRNPCFTPGTTDDLQRFYEGQIDEFALLGSQLSDAQVLDLFQSQSPGYAIQKTPRWSSARPTATPSRSVIPWRQPIRRCRFSCR
ncbi:MAG: LamG-like jellyroll fold domain-containing protein [Planctomycetaceae bacterium]